MDNPLDIITLTFTRKQWYEILECAGNELFSIPEEVEVMIVAALCPDGHKEEVEYWPREQRGFGKWGYWEGHCINCGTNIWRIEEQVIGYNRPGTYRYINWLTDHYPGVIFTPGDENDPKKVKLGKKSSRSAKGTGFSLNR